MYNTLTKQKEDEMKTLRENLEQFLRETENPKEYKVYGGKEKSIYVKNNKRVLTQNELEKLNNINALGIYPKEVETVGVDKEGQIFVFLFEILGGCEAEVIASYFGIDADELLQALRKEWKEERYNADFKKAMEEDIKKHGENFFMAMLIEISNMEKDFNNEVKEIMSKMD